MPSPTQQLIFDDGSICSACLGYRKIEREPWEQLDRAGHEERGWPPDGVPTDRFAAWFCDCGHESPFVRELTAVETPIGPVETDPHTVDETSYKRAIKRAIVALEAVGHDVDRYAFAIAALQAWHDTIEPAGYRERELEAGLDPAIEAGVTVRSEETDGEIQVAP